MSQTIGPVPASHGTMHCNGAVTVIPTPGDILWQDTIQAKTQSRDFAGQRNIDRLLSEGSRLTVKKGFQREGGGVAGSVRPAFRVAGLAFLKWPPPLFSRCIFSRHQTGPLRSMSKRASLRKGVPTTN